MFLRVQAHLIQFVYVKPKSDVLLYVRTGPCSMACIYVCTYIYIYIFVVLFCLWTCFPIWHDGPWCCLGSPCIRCLRAGCDKADVYRRACSMNGATQYIHLKGTCRNGAPMLTNKSRHCWNDWWPIEPWAMHFYSEWVCRETSSPVSVLEASVYT